MVKKGSGWHGESKRHSEVAKRGAISRAKNSSERFYTRKTHKRLQTNKNSSVWIKDPKLKQTITKMIYEKNGVKYIDLRGFYGTMTKTFRVTGLSNSGLILSSKPQKPKDFFDYKSKMVYPAKFIKRNGGYEIQYSGENGFIQYYWVDVK